VTLDLLFLHVEQALARWIASHLYDGRARQAIKYDGAPVRPEFDPYGRRLNRQSRTARDGGDPSAFAPHLCAPVD